MREKNRDAVIASLFVMTYRAYKAALSLFRWVGIQPCQWTMVKEEDYSHTVLLFL